MYGFDPSRSSTLELRAGAAGTSAVQEIKTPVERIGLKLDGLRRDVHLKLESYNPGGSIKHRTALGLLQHMEKNGRLLPGGRLVESSSGNLAISLAMLCHERGYHYTAVVDPMASKEKIHIINNLGADVIMVDEPDENGGYLITRLEHISRMLADDPDLVWTDQYHNDANPEAHYTGIAPEMFGQMNQKLDAVFVAVSTGGTLAGIARYLREKSPNTQIIAVDAEGSVALGGRPGMRLLSGIGSSRPSSFLNSKLYDELIFIGDAEAFAWCRKVENETGISVGGSSGACIAASAKYLTLNRDIESAVCVCADHGQFYASSIFNDGWLMHNGIDVGGQLSSSECKIVV